MCCKQNYLLQKKYPIIINCHICPTYRAHTVSAIPTHETCKKCLSGPGILLIMWLESVWCSHRKHWCHGAQTPSNGTVFIQTQEAAVFVPYVSHHYHFKYIKQLHSFKYSITCPHFFSIHMQHLSHKWTSIINIDSIILDLPHLYSLKQLNTGKSVYMYVCPSIFNNHFAKDPGKCSVKCEFFRCFCS